MDRAVFLHIRRGIVRLMFLLLLLQTIFAQNSFATEWGLLQ